MIASTLEVVAVADLPVAARSSNYLLTRRMTYHEDGNTRRVPIHCNATLGVSQAPAVSSASRHATRRITRDDISEDRLDNHSSFFTQSLVGDGAEVRARTADRLFDVSLSKPRYSISTHPTMEKLW